MSLLVTWAGSACGGDRVVFVDFPNLDAAAARPSGDLVWCDGSVDARAMTGRELRSEILVARDESGRVDAFAVALPRDVARHRMRVRASADVVLEALFYEAKLGDLGLGEGPIEIADEGGGCALPAPEAVFRRTLGGSADWTQADAMSAEVATLRVSQGCDTRGCEAEPAPPGFAPPCACGDWEETSFPLDAHGDALVALELPDGSALLSFYADPEEWHGVAFRVAVDAVSAPIEPLGMPELFPTGALPSVFYGAALDGGGQLWLSGPGGTLWRGEVRDGEIAAGLAATSSAGQDLHWLVARGSEAGGDLVLYGLGSGHTASGVPTEGLALFRFEGARLERLETFKLDDRKFPLGGLAMAPDGEVFAVSRTEPKLLRVRGRDVTRVLLPREIEPNEVAFIPWLGVVVGTGAGEVLIAGEAGACPFATGTAGLPSRVRAIAEVEGGLVYAGNLQALGRYVRGEGFCGVASFGANAIEEVVDLGGTLLLAGDAPESTGDRPSVTLLRRGAR